MNVKIKINQEYAKLVPPLTELELSSLKESIKLNGQWHPIIVNEQGFILDGHHRFKVCQGLNIEPKVEVKRSFSAEIAEEKLFVIDSNLKRRQLNDFQKAELVYSLEKVLRDAARKRQLSSLKRGKNRTKLLVPSGSNGPNGETENGKGRTADLISTKIGIPATMYKRARKIILKGSESAKQRLRSGKSKISKEYNKITQIERIKNAEKARSENIDLAFNDSNFQLMLGPVEKLGNEIADNSIAMIFTDPPYDKKHLYLYDELATLALRVLKPGGSLAVIVPNGGPEFEYVFDRIRQSGLKFHHYIALLHGGRTDRLHKLGIWVDHKPLLWFSKLGIKDQNQERPTKYFDLHNVIRSNPPSKIDHEWEQSVEETEYMINPLTVKGDVILDPFMGTGTTGIACIKLNRKFIGIEIDPAHYKNAQGRLSSTAQSGSKKIE